MDIAADDGIITDEDIAIDEASTRSDSDDGAES